MLVLRRIIMIMISAGLMTAIMSEPPVIAVYQEPEGFWSPLCHLVVTREHLLFSMKEIHCAFIPPHGQGMIFGSIA